MQLKDLRTFAFVVQTGNLHQAAERLGVTQPAISKAVRRLETALNVRLLERTARGVALTEFGKALYQRSSMLEIMTDAIHTEIADMRHGRAGVLRLGTVPALVEKVVAPVLAHFLETQRDVRFQMRVQLSNELLRDLQQGDLDLVIAAMPASGAKDLNHLLLGRQQACVVACRNHPLAQGGFTLADLATQKWLLLPADITLRQWVESMFLEAGVPVPEVFVETDASPAIFAALVRNTRLLTVLTRDMLDSPMGAGLVPLPAPAPTWSIQLALFWRRQAYFSALMSSCREQIVEAFEHRG